jgi:hypothetical protein
MYAKSLKLRLNRIDTFRVSTLNSNTDRKLPIAIIFTTVIPMIVTESTQAATHIFIADPTCDSFHWMEASPYPEYFFLPFHDEEMAK